MIAIDCDSTAPSSGERGNQPLRIQSKVVGGAMLVLQQCLGMDSYLQTLQIERDAYAKRGGAAKERVELHADTG